MTEPRDDAVPGPVSGERGAEAAADRSRPPSERLRGHGDLAPGTASPPATPATGTSAGRSREPSPEPEPPSPAVIAVGDRPPAYQPERAAAGSPVPAVETGGSPRKPGSFLRELPILLVIAVVLALLIKTFLVQAFFIPSGSMEQTLHVHDRVLVNKLSFHTGSPQRGEIVVFNTAGTAFADPNGGEYVPCPKSNPVVSGVRAVQRFIGVGTCGEDDYIKRIIAVPGDTIRCCDAQNQIILDGKPLREPYLYENTAQEMFCRESEQMVATAGSHDPSVCSPSSPPITVPAGRYWVMGDHRDDSEDSRFKGFVPRDKLVGRAFVRIYPLSRIGFLRVPSSFRGAGAAMVGLAGTPAVAAPALAVPLVGVRLRRRRRS